MTHDKAGKDALVEENERLMAEVVLYRRLVSAHHTDAERAADSVTCPICIKFYADCGRLLH